MAGWWPTPYSYNSTVLSAAPYSAYLLEPYGTLQQTTVSVDVPRHATPPAAVDKQYAALDFELRIDIVPGYNYSDYMPVLAALFDTRDRTLRTFVVTNAYDSNKQYQRQCYAVDAHFEKPTYIVKLHCPDPIYRTVTQLTDTWNITATGQTHTIAIGGHAATQPTIQVTPTTVKGGGFNYKRYSLFYNPTAVLMANYPLDIIAALNTAALVADTSISNQINQGGGINNSVTTIPIDTAVGGGLPATGTGYVDTEQISWTGTGVNLTGVTRGINGTTAASHADNAVISISDLQADGDDLRGFVNNNEQNVWLGGMNTSATKLWTVLNLPPLVSVPVSAMGSGDVSLTVPYSKANNALVAALPTSGAGLIDTEAITWTGKSPGNGRKDSGTLSGLTRGARNTTAATHSLNATLYVLPLNAVAAYGDSTKSALVTDDTNKPIFALTSTNTSWVYSNFSTLSGKRAGEWKSAVAASLAQVNYRTTTPYTGTETANGNIFGFADPSTALGMHLASFRAGAGWLAENGSVVWSFYHPGGFTSITPAGNYYRDTGVTWPSATMQVSTNGSTWITKSTVSSPTAATWTAWTPGAISLGATYNYVRFIMTGPIAAGAGPAGTGLEADWEITSVTLALDSTKVPQVTLKASQSAYEFNFTLTNTDSSEALGFNHAGSLNKAVEIDCRDDYKTAKYLSDNANVRNGLSKNTIRQHWLDCAGGATLHLQYDDTGTAGVSVVFKWYDCEI